MHIAFAVFFLLIVHVVSYPSLLEVATDDEDMMERTAESDEDSQGDDSDQYENAMNKRQGGYNIIKPGLKCEIECVEQLRHPQTGPGMSIKDASKACQGICANTNKKRKLTNDDHSNTNKQQLREFSNYLIEQLQLNHNE